MPDMAALAGMMARAGPKELAEIEAEIAQLEETLRWLRLLRDTMTRNVAPGPPPARPDVPRVNGHPPSVGPMPAGVRGPPDDGDPDPTGEVCRRRGPRAGEGTLYRRLHLALGDDVWYTKEEAAAVADMTPAQVRSAVGPHTDWFETAYHGVNGTTGRRQLKIRKRPTPP